MKILNSTDIPDSVILVRIKDGIRYGYEQGDIVPVLESAAGIVLRDKNSAKADIDLAAGQCREKYITVSPGQTAVYILKQSEAEKYKTATYPVDLTGYPFIASESVSTGIDPKTICDSILAKAAEWIAVGASIEQIRMKAKQDINNSNYSSLIFKIVDNAITELGNL